MWTWGGERVTKAACVGLFQWLERTPFRQSSIFQKLDENLFTILDYFVSLLDTTIDTTCRRKNFRAGGCAYRVILGSPSLLNINTSNHIFTNTLPCVLN